MSNIDFTAALKKIRPETSFGCNANDYSQIFAIAENGEHITYPNKPTHAELESAWDEIVAEQKANEYKVLRANAYPPMAEYLDAIVKNDNNRLGLALNFSPKWINFFLASDFITNKFNKQLLPINKFDINIHAGISFYLGNDQ